MTELEELQEQVKRLELELQLANQKLKWSNPIQRVSFKRLKLLVEMACLDVKRIGSKICVYAGSRKKKIFKSLREAYEFFTQDEWYLTDLFPVPELVPVPVPEPEPEPEPEPKPRRSARPCKFCGKAIEWHQENGKWVPFNLGTQERHHCTKHKSKPKECKQCGGLIQWFQDVIQGRWFPIDLETNTRHICTIETHRNRDGDVCSMEEKILASETIPFG